MNASGPALRDIHLPPAAWWPPAPGWWIVAALVVLVIGLVAWLLWRRARRRPLRAALREVDALAIAYARNGDGAQLADGASRLLRRVARVVDAGAASLSGDAWRGFLHRYARNAQVAAALDGLDEAVFRPRPDIDAPATLAALRAFSRDALRTRYPNPLSGGERATGAQSSAGEGAQSTATPPSIATVPGSR